MTQNTKSPVEKRLNIKTIQQGDLTWVDISDPSEEAKKFLTENYKFHPMDIEDCFSRRQLSKVDEYENYLFIVFHFPVYDKVTKLSTVQQWVAFVSDKSLVTLHPSSLKAMEDSRQEFEFDEDSRKEYFSHGSGYLLYALVDRTVDFYFPVLDKILSLLDGIEDSVFDEGIEAAKEISVLRRDIVVQRRVMFPTRALLIELENKLKRFANTNLSVYYGDLVDHMSKICETLDECKDTIEVFKDADYTLSGYRANRMIRILAVTLAMVLPFIIVTGLYSMNIKLPGNLQNNVGTFYILLSIMLAATGGVLYFFHKKRLI